MNQAALVFRGRISSCDRLLNAGEAISAQDQDIFYSSVLQCIQYGQPVLCAFIFTDLDRQDFFLSLAVDPQDNIGSHFPYDVVVTDRVMDRVYEQHRVNFV